MYLPSWPRNQALAKELARLRGELDEHRTAAEKARALAEENKRARASAEELARKEREDRAVWAWRSSRLVVTSGR
jgi:hypothetical protein